jgi:mannose-1-phosphate guanylyltransferase / phosphomannomutase
MRAMILAAGLGSRLHPLTAHLPKPLVPICNRPLLWHLIRRIAQAGIDEIAINLHYRGDQIRRWLGHGEHHGVKVTYSEEIELLGSAGGVRRMRDFFGDEPALIVHGDILFDVDLSAIIQYHLARSAQATLVLHPAHQRYNYGKIKLNAQGQIGQFVEQCASGVDGPFIDTVFTGVQILDPEILEAIPAGSGTSLTTAVYPGLLAKASRFYGYLMHGYWSDIGAPRRYWETSMDVVGGRVGSAVDLLHDECDPTLVCHAESSLAAAIRPPLVCASDVGWQGGARLGPEVILGEGCRLSHDVCLVQSVLWPRVHVGRGVTIERSIILNDVIIPDGSRVVEKVVSVEGIIDL